jgi:hypothetical protein
MALLRGSFVIGLEAQLAASVTERIVVLYNEIELYF